MVKEYRLVLQQREKNRPPSEAQKRQRDRFALAAAEAKKEMAGSRLRGAQRVEAFNRLVAQKLRESP
jgi:hypothetical protein